MNKELMKFLKLNEQLENIVLDCLSSDLKCIIPCRGEKSKVALDFMKWIFSLDLSNMNAIMKTNNSTR